MRAVGSRKGSTGGLRGENPTSKIAPDLAKGTYYVRFGRLYYVLNYDFAASLFHVENCQTLYSYWVTAEQMDRDEVRVLERQ